MPKTNTEQKAIDKVLDRGVIVEILPSKKEFREELLKGKRLRFYIGADATAPSLHLSHAKNYMILEEFRQLGHEVIVLFGDFTAKIGDPSDRLDTRKQIDDKEIKKNVDKWIEQIRPLMDFDAKKNPPRVLYNSEWLGKLSFGDVIGLASNFTVQQMLERDMFEKRMKQGSPIFLHEFMYPLMQGYDSVAMDVDVELCGMDQTFNALVGRTLVKRLNKKDKFVVTVNLMENPVTKELMSKSKGTGVFLGQGAGEMYGAIMSQPDEMIEILLVNNTRIPLKKVEELKKMDNPRDAKMVAAHEITKLFYGQKGADGAQEEFVSVIQNKEAPSEVAEVQLKAKSLGAVDLFVQAGLAKSKAEAKRLIAQKGAKVDDKVVASEDEKFEIPEEGLLLQKGKRHFVKVR